MSEQIKLELTNLEEKSKEIIIELENKLSEEQTKVLKLVYDKIKESTELLLYHPKLDHTVKLTQMIASIIKLLESIKINDLLLSGKDKKQISLELGRILIKDVVKEDEKRVILMMIYENTSEQVLETMIDVSHHVNIKIKELIRLEYHMLRYLKRILTLRLFNN